MTVSRASSLLDGQRVRPRLILAVCSLSVFLIGLDSTIVTIGLPAIGRSLHAGVSGLQWSVTAYTVTLASLLMFSGSVADRIGRRPLLQAGLSVFVLGSWLCSLAPDLPSLVVFRVIQGIGGSAMNPAALGIITNTFTDPARRARAIGVWDAAYGLSMILGPLVGGILVSAAGWRAIFWASIPAGLAALALTGLFVPDSRAPRPRRSDPVGQALVTVMLATLATGIIQAPSWGWMSPETTLLFTISGAALAALMYIEPRRPDPLIQFRLFRRASFAAANLTAVCGIAALAGFGFLSTLYLQDVRSMTALRAGLTIWPMAAEMAVCAPLAGRIIARNGARIPTVLAGSALAASAATLTRLTGASSPAFLSVTYSLFGVGVGLLNPAITYGVMSGVPDGQAGLASGMNSSSRQLGQCLGVAVTGTLLAGSLQGTMQSGYLAAARAGWWAIAGCGLGVVLAGLCSVSRRPTPRQPAGRHARPRIGFWLVLAGNSAALPGHAWLSGPSAACFSARHARPGRKLPWQSPASRQHLRSRRLPGCRIPGRSPRPLEVP
jgi:EmrB/QacA subfamily drug resistance transporter